MESSSCFRIAAIITLLVLAGCKPAVSPEPVAPVAPAPPVSPAPPPPDMGGPASTGTVVTPAPMPSADGNADPWIDMWRGPEGTFMRIGPSVEGYAVMVQNLDGLRTFPGTLEDEHIEFTRDGVKESVRHGDGKATGMKWLADKKDCLVVKSGEGYCRD